MAGEPSGDGIDGCPVCDWSGRVAETHDYTHRYYTHVKVVDGEILSGKTCSIGTRPKRSFLGKIPLISRFVDTETVHSDEHGGN